MEKHFICLANSKKYNGRCIAGILIKNQNDKWIIENKNGKPVWIRPVSNNEHGEIPLDVAQNFKLFDIIKIDVKEECPKHSQTENVYYKHLSKIGNISLNESNCEFLRENYRNLIFHNKGKAIPTDVYKSGDYSLMFIKCNDHDFEYDENSKLRIKFCYKQNRYDLPITDQDFINTYNNNKVKSYDNIFLTISLGVEYNDWHYKLVAGVVTV